VELDIRLRVYRLPSTVYRLPSTVYRLPSTVYRLPSTVYRLPGHRLGSASSHRDYLRKVSTMHDSPEPSSCEAVSKSELPAHTCDDAPRLSLVHLFAWTTACAVYMAILRPQLARSSSPSATLTASVAITVPLHGLFLTGFLLFGYRWLRGRAFAREPGDWLLVANGTATAIMLLNHLLGALAITGWLGRAPLLNLLPSAALALVYAMASSLFKTLRYWRVTLLLLCVMPALNFALEALLRLFSGPIPEVLRRFINFLSMNAHVYWYTPVIYAGILVAGAAIIDVKRGIRRHWTHWVGIASVVAQGALALVFLLLWLSGRLGP
jgi:hypothetical protein